MNSNTQMARVGAQRGFTLIEILVVVALIGLLAAFIVPNVIGQSEKARVDLARANMNAISTQLEMFRMHNGRYPTSEEGLRALVEKPATARNWTTPYLSKMPEDPWNNPYVYMSPGINGPYDLISLGADAREGGEGFDADISFRDTGTQ
ncbi:MAG: type II secretion system major pseudopilin GspG [Alcanivoracaceae bacterium]|jgi:general secretion pathway protein G|nr:type II secretion system major pseudopilin GspG [Alcanivoracaceae bacterium]